MHDIKYNMMIAKYSAGYPLGEIEKDYIEVLNGAFDFWKDDPELSKRINMASIGILLEIKGEYFDLLIKFIDETGEKEYMFDYLFHFLKPEREVSDRVCFDKVFGWIKVVTKMSKSSAEDFLSKYLKSEWYASHGDFYRYNNHMKKVNVYFGYWCFEAGAIVKIMGLDDSSFKDNMYYPYDLVHCLNRRLAGIL